MYINVKDGIIREIISAKGNYQSKEYQTIHVPDTFAGIVGDNVAIFNETWEIRNISELVTEKLITLAIDEKLVGENIVKKNIQELVDEGIIQLKKNETIENGSIIEKTDIHRMIEGEIEKPKGMKIVDKDGVLTMEKMTVEEMFSAGEITQEEKDCIEEQQILEQRKYLYMNESDPLYFSYCAGESTKEEWLAKRREIKDRFPMKIKSKT